MKSASSATDPSEFAQVFARNFNTGLIDTLLAGYSSDAVLNLGAGAKFHGPDEIRQALANFLAPRLPIVTTPVHSEVAGDTAIVYFDWQIRGTAPDGQSVQMGGRAIDVLRRDPRGHWLQLLDLPFGVATPA